MSQAKDYRPKQESVDAGFEQKSVSTDNKATQITTLVYALQALSFVVGITSIAGLIINYIKKDDVAGTWLESHFRWQIRTFWFALLWGVIGGILTIVLIGFLILAIDAIWLIYRIVRGWMNLAERKPMY